MTSIRQLKKQRKKEWEDFMECIERTIVTCDGDTVRFEVVVGAGRRQRTIISKTYLRRVLEVQKTRKNKTEEGGTL